MTGPLCGTDDGAARSAPPALFRTAVTSKSGIADGVLAMGGPGLAGSAGLVTARSRLATDGPAAGGSGPSDGPDAVQIGGILLGARPNRACSFENGEEDIQPEASGPIRLFSELCRGRHRGPVSLHDADFRPITRQRGDGDRPVLQGYIDLAPLC